MKSKTKILVTMSIVFLIVLGVIIFPFTMTIERVTFLHASSWTSRKERYDIYSDGRIVETVSYDSTLSLIEMLEDKELESNDFKIFEYTFDEVQWKKIEKSFKNNAFIYLPKELSVNNIFDGESYFIEIVTTRGNVYRSGGYMPNEKSIRFKNILIEIVEVLKKCGTNYGELSHN